MKSGQLHLDFGLYHVDLKRIIRYLKQDIKDDWLLDPLLFEDRLEPKNIIQYFKKNITENNGEYVPSNRLKVNVPKKGDTLRYSLETHVYDRIAYHAFGETLVRHFDTLISRRVLNHRFDVRSLKEAKPRYLYLNSIEQWQKFEEFVKVGSVGKTILHTDIQNYYENIHISDLRAILLKSLSKISATGKEKAQIRFCIEAISRCLRSWSYDEICGIPQNRDISSFLANIYMLPVDEHMIDSDFDYYRYMDDIKIVCKDKYHARKALKILINELRKVGLNVNASKTSIDEVKNEDHFRPSEEACLTLERIDSMINSRRKPIVALAFQDVRNKLLLLVKEKQVTGREFRFCIGRICKIALCKDITKPSDFFTEITECIINLISELPYVTDQFYSYLISTDVSHAQLDIIRDYLLDEEKAIYGWQNYLLWKIFVHHNYHDTSLLKHALELIQKRGNTPNKAGALLYVGMHGEQSQKQIILSNFKDNDDFILQRHSLISIQELPYRDIKDSISHYVKPESEGIYRTLKKFSSPKYLEPPDPISYKDLIREGSFYA